MLAERCAERTAVLVTTAADARASGWTEDLLVAVTERLARGRSVLLIDTIGDSALPERLAADPLEGLADVLLFGASLKHVVQQPGGFPFAFVPAGAAAQSEIELADPRWRRLLSEAQAAGYQTVVHTDAAAPGLEHVRARIGSEIALGHEGAGAPGGTDLLAVITPPPSPVPPSPAPPAPPPAARELSRDEQFEAIRVPRNAAREALIADLRSRQRAALMSPPPALEPLPGVGATRPPAPPLPSDRRTPSRATASLAEPDFLEPGFSAPVSGPRVKSRPWWFWALSLAVLAAFAAGTWIMVARPFGVAPVADTAGPVAPAVRPGAVPLPYSVAIEAHQQLPTATERVEALRNEEPDLDFYIAPSLLDGVLYYRVMAGPVADSVTVGAVLRRLIEKGHKTGTSPGDVLATPLAFLIGEYDAAGAAQQRAREALNLAIPAYVLEVPGDGESRWRVYAGAYAGQAEANVMRQLLKSAGLPDTLVQRIGAR